MCTKILFFISKIYRFSDKVDEKIYRVFEILFIFLTFIAISNSNVYYYRFYLIGTLLLTPIALKVYLRKKYHTLFNILLASQYYYTYSF
jgi:hypothetical protein